MEQEKRVWINVRTIDRQIAECKRRLATSLDPDSRNLEQKELERLELGEEQFYANQERDTSTSAVGDREGMRIAE